MQQKDDGGSFRVSMLSVILTSFCIMFFTFIITICAFKQSVTIVDNGKAMKVATFKDTVQEVLNQNNINLNQKDKVTPSLNSKVKPQMQIAIKRAIPITLKDGKTKKKIYTNKKTVQQVLDEQEISLDKNDKINVDPTSRIVRDLVLKITRIKKDTIVEKQPIAYNMRERETTTISRGSRKVIKQGKEGLKKKVYKVTYENGEITDKKLIEENIVSWPVNGIVKVGVEPRVAVARGKRLRYSRQLTMTATAYTAGYESTGKRPGDPEYGVTASGMHVRRGVVAVDPNVIPLGTKLYVESTDGYKSYGYAIAADTGSAIKGNRIDLYYSSLSKALNFGKRKVKVYVLE